MRSTAVSHNFRLCAVVATNFRLHLNRLYISPAGCVILSIPDPVPVPGCQLRHVLVLVGRLCLCLTAICSLSLSVWSTLLKGTSADDNMIRQCRVLTRTRPRSGKTNAERL